MCGLHVAALHTASDNKFNHAIKEAILEDKLEIMPAKEALNMISAHRGRARGGARARGARARARARHAALGAGRGHLQGHANLSNMPAVNGIRRAWAPVTLCLAWKENMVI